MSERDTNSLTPKEWISGIIGALIELFGVSALLVFAWVFALDFYRSSRIEDIELPGGKFSSAMYDAQFCRSSPDPRIRGIYGSTRIGLWLDRVSFRSVAYVHAKDTLRAISAAQEFQRVGDEAAANQAIEDARRGCAGPWSHTSHQLALMPKLRGVLTNATSQAARTVVPSRILYA